MKGHVCRSSEIKAVALFLGGVLPKCAQLFARQSVHTKNSTMSGGANRGGINPNHTLIQVREGVKKNGKKAVRLTITQNMTTCR